MIILVEKKICAVELTSQTSQSSLTSLFVKPMLTSSPAQWPPVKKQPAYIKTNNAWATSKITATTADTFWL
jgi:hypothetical protein